MFSTYIFAISRIAVQLLFSTGICDIHENVLKVFVERKHIFDLLPASKRVVSRLFFIQSIEAADQLLPKSILCLNLLTIIGLLRSNPPFVCSLCKITYCQGKGFIFIRVVLIVFYVNILADDKTSAIIFLWFVFVGSF